MWNFSVGAFSGCCEDSIKIVNNRENLSFDMEKFENHEWNCPSLILYIFLKFSTVSCVSEILCI
jgi:hypothetical protein